MALLERKMETTGDEKDNVYSMLVLIFLKTAEESLSKFQRSCVEPFQGYWNLESLGKNTRDI